MTYSRRAALLMALLVTAGCQGLGRPGGQAGQRGTGGAEKTSAVDLATVDVCSRIPGPQVAEAVGGQRADVLSFRASEQQSPRCRYSVVGGKGGSQVFIIWLMPPTEFDRLRFRQDNPVTPLSNLGDGAYVTVIGGAQRLDLYLLKRGVATIEITGDDRPAVTKIARLAFARL
jgi:hypothetical protein